MSRRLKWVVLAGRFVREGSRYHSVEQRKQIGEPRNWIWITDCGVQLPSSFSYVERAAAEKIGVPCHRCFK